MSDEWEYDSGIPEIDPGPLYNQNEHYLRERVPGEDVTDQQLRADATNPEGWLHYNKGPEMHGFSPATRLRPETIDSFEKQYELTFPSTLYQCNPLVVPGDPPVIYVGLGNMAVQAIDARSGDRYWRFGYSLENTAGVNGRTRGIAVWKDTAYLAASDLRLVALDRYTGEFQWKTWLLSERQREHIERPEKMGQSQAPVAYDGTIVVGQSGGFGSWGALLGVDADSGEIRWAQDVCRPENWVGESWRYGDGASWMSPAIDPENGLAFYPTGNAGVRYNGTVRPGPNRDANSVVAIDIETGDVAWSYQLLAQDWFDWDCTTTPRVFDLVVAGEQRRVVAAEDKSGWSHIIDAETGQLVERTEPFAKQGGDQPEDLEFLTIPGYSPLNVKYMWPDDSGGTNWSPDAYSPQSGLMYVGGNDIGQEFYWLPGYEYDPDRIEIVPGGGRGEFSEERACRLAAIDPADGGSIAWTYEYDVTPGERVQAGGTTATGGGLVFAGSAAKKLLGLDATTGEKLWEDDIGAVVESSPVFWDDPVEERQYMAVTYDTEGSGSAPEGKLAVYATEAGIDPLAVPETTATPTPNTTSTTTADESESEQSDDATLLEWGVLGGLLAGGAAAARRVLRESDDEEP